MGGAESKSATAEAEARATRSLGEHNARRAADIFRHLTPNVDKAFALKDLQVLYPDLGPATSEALFRFFGLDCAQGRSEADLAKTGVTEAQFRIGLAALVSPYEAEVAAFLAQLFARQDPKEALTFLIRRVAAESELWPTWAGVAGEEGRDVARLADDLLRELKGRTPDDVEKWAREIPLVPGLVQLFVLLELGLARPESAGSRVPACVRGTPKAVASLLSRPALLRLSALLPTELRAELRLLFHSGIHGQSFSRLLGDINEKGPCILVARDKAGGVFGGFASKGFVLGPQFTGDERSFLFTLAPEMRVFPATGYNQNFAYLNLHQQTMANGLAFGGIEMAGEEISYFALWLSPEYGSGSSAADSSAFHNARLSAEGTHFRLDVLEVWGAGPPPKPLPGSPQRSILDSTDTETKAMLELMGRKTYSDAFREPDEAES